MDSLALRRTAAVWGGRRHVDAMVGDGCVYCVQLFFSGGTYVDGIT